MNLFINDILFRIQSTDEVTTSKHPISFFSDLSNVHSWGGEVVLKGVSPKEFSQLLILFFKEDIRISFSKLTYIVDRNEDKKKLKNELRRYFSIIDAAGGVVFKQTNVLLIHRLGKWDLPKGKRDKGEKMREAAVREVLEECGVSAKLETKITTTWHTYTYKGKPTLKRTKWYAMQAIDDQKMTPQLDENIEKVEWATPTVVNDLFHDTYASIQFVWEKTKKTDYQGIISGEKGK